MMPSINFMYFLGDVLLLSNDRKKRDDENKNVFG